MGSDMIIVGYGILSAAAITVAYVGLTVFKRNHRQAMLQERIVRYVRLPQER